VLEAVVEHVHTPTEALLHHPTDHVAPRAHRHHDAGELPP
jgi:hypothetical protein